MNSHSTLALKVEGGGDQVVAHVGPHALGSFAVVLDAAIAQLPAEVSVGHLPNDDAESVARAVQVRTDSAGCSQRFAQSCRDRHVGFALVARSNRAIQAAISRIQHDEARWAPALRQDGEARQGSAVTEVRDFVDLSAWPPGTRLIVRREPLHPGAQTTLFPSLEYRYWGHYTDAEGEAVELDAHMRAHAHVEDHIRRLKDSGLCRFPFADLDANPAWLAVVCFAADLVRWFQLLCLVGPLAAAQPKALRWRLWHSPARIVRHTRRSVVRILDGWPSEAEVLAAYRPSPSSSERTGCEGFPVRAPPLASPVAARPLQRRSSSPLSPVSLLDRSNMDQTAPVPQPTSSDVTAPIIL